jgi:hypothetical protein
LALIQSGLWVRINPGNGEQSDTLPSEYLWISCSPVGFAIGDRETERFFYSEIKTPFSNV